MKTYTETIAEAYRLVCESNSIDEQYMHFVNCGNMEMCFKMVREAAARSMPNTKVVDKDGLPQVMYHGSDNNSVTIFDGRIYGGTYFTTIKSYSEERAKDNGGKVFSAFINIENPLDIKADEPIEDVTGVYDYTDLRGKALIENGNDGAIIHFKSGNKDTFSIKPSQIKSADPVTYDDDGNVILLSKRFDVTNPDIRY